MGHDNHEARLGLSELQLGVSARVLVSEIQKPHTIAQHSFQPRFDGIKK